MTTTDFRSLVGEEAADLYPLQSWLGGAVYTTVYGEESQPAVIKLIQFDGADGERQLIKWSETSRLSHPGLVRIFDFGHCEIHGVPFLYVVMERADGSLAEVLTERSLTPAEAQEMLTCTAGALSCLHENGFVHGRVKAANIMAVGDQIKLTTDSVVRGHEAGDDVRSLGLTLPEALKPLPQPFEEIVEHCLRQNDWTASQVASYWSGSAPPAAAPRSRWPIYAIAAVMIAITAIVLLLRSRPGPTPAPVQPEASHVSITTLPEEPAAPVKPKPNGGWYVVAATYTRQADAEKRANSITRKWPRFKAEIYSPEGARYYLVVIGSGLSQRDAAAVQQRAIAAGMPHDTYIKRLSRTE
jgi:Serine/threonine protein kinase